jgi:tetratricopeptide (TPR) repeat protein
MPPLSRVLSLVGLVVFASGCRKEQPAPRVTPAVPSSRASANAPVTASAAVANGSATAAAKPAEPAPPVRKPTPLDAAGLRVAKAYILELSQGRKATLAKDYAQAEAHFSKSLEALPGDPRALAERGYARLLASKLPEAEADLAAATRGAPSSAVLLQILHNRMLVARQRGDEAAALGFEAQKKALKASRRLPSGVTCNNDVTASDLAPQVSDSLDDALKQLLAAHAAEDATDVSAVKFDEGPLSENQADQLRLLAAKGPLPDGGWQLWASGNAHRNHALIAHAGKLYGFPNQSSGGLSLCGLDQAADVTIGGGGPHPWYIQRAFRQLERGYITDEGSGQTMGFCGWASTSIDVTILDSHTFRGIRTLSASAQPTDDGSAQEPEHLLELEWQADNVVVDACGQRTVVPYTPE